MSKNDKQQALVPRLRFPEFRNAGEWESMELGDVCNPRQWATISSSTLTESGYPVYGANGFIGFYSEYNHDDETIAITCRGSTCGDVSLIPPKSYITGNSMALDDLKVEKINRSFLFQYLKRRGFKDVISGSAQPQIVGTAIKCMKIVIPEIEEQQKIADCLSSLDDLIAAEERKLAALRDHKKGLMQQLFPREGETRPRLRFPEFRNAGEWVKGALCEFGEIVTGMTPNTKEARLWDGDILFITPTDISEDGKYQFSAARAVRESKGMRVLPPGSVVYTCIASIGKMALTVRPSVTNQQINAVIPNKKSLGEFIYYALASLTPWIKTIPASSTLPIINKSEFSKIEIVQPQDLAEQQKIADCLSSLDALIDAQVKKLDALRTHKRGLMQQLFPSPEDTGV